MQKLHNIILSSTIIGFSLFFLVKGVRYKAQTANEDSCRPCPGKGSETLESIFDTKNLQISWIDDENIELNGYIMIHRDLPTSSPIVGNFRFERKTGANWSPIPYKIHYNDFCKSIYNSSEMHFKYIKTWPEELGPECPMKKGVHLPFDHVIANTVLDVAVPNAEGRYRGFLDFAMGSVKLCCMLYGELLKL